MKIRSRCKRIALDHETSVRWSTKFCLELCFAGTPGHRGSQRSLRCCSAGTSKQLKNRDVGVSATSGPSEFNEFETSPFHFVILLSDSFCGGVRSVSFRHLWLHDKFSCHPSEKFKAKVTNSAAIKVFHPWSRLKSPHGCGTPHGSRMI